MKEIVVISGKGGTGKTSIVAAFAAIAQSTVLADCDVDAADLHLVLDPHIRDRGEFRASKVASINKELCTECDRCRELCRFNAIDQNYVVDRISCEGCGVCVEFCPQEAIEFHARTSGQWFISETRCGPMVHARLGIAEENSGKLVTVVRNKAAEIAETRGAEFVIVDGPPGIGCPVIASMTGASLVLIVTEPTASAQHDLLRVAEVAKHFGIPAVVCINKSDLNSELSSRITEEAEARDLRVVGRVPYDETVTRAQVAGQSIVEYAESPVVQAIRIMWHELTRSLKDTGGQHVRTEELQDVYR
jgi:MinD superfamily P-loop ATPase